MVLYKTYPSLDLHGMDKEFACFKVKEFLEDSSKLGYSYVIIVHGIGQGILKESVQKYLKKDKHVLEYKLDFMNPGCTIVHLKENIDKKTKK